MRVGRRLDESNTYAKARDALLKAEIELRDAREKLAEQRRSLPLDAPAKNYVFTEGSLHDSSANKTKVKLEDLFLKPEHPLILQQYMLGGAQKNPCPMCTLWTDGLNAIAHHLAQRVNFAVIVEAEIDDLLAVAHDRNWHNLRLLSSLGTSFKKDYQFENDDKQQFPGMSVFVNNEDGTVWHSYSGSAILGEDEYRGMDLLCPLWHLFDLTPQGRGEFFPELAYDSD